MLQNLIRTNRFHLSYIILYIFLHEYNLGTPFEIITNIFIFWCYRIIYNLEKRKSD